MLCPACNRDVITVSSNGFCHNCPEYKKYNKMLTVYDRPSGRYERVKRFTVRPLGRSGRIENGKTKRGEE